MISEIFRTIGSIVLGLCFLASMGYMTFWSISWIEIYETETYPPKQVPYYVNEFVLWIDELFGIGVSDLITAHFGFYLFFFGFIAMCIYATMYRKGSDENDND